AGTRAGRAGTRRSRGGSRAAQPPAALRRATKPEPRSEPPSADAAGRLWRRRSRASWDDFPSGLPDVKDQHVSPDEQQDERLDHQRKVAGELGLDHRAADTATG